MKENIERGAHAVVKTKFGNRARTALRKVNFRQLEKIFSESQALSLSDVKFGKFDEPSDYQKTIYMYEFISYFLINAALIDMPEDSINDVIYYTNNNPFYKSYRKEPLRDYSYLYNVADPAFIYMNTILANRDSYFRKAIIKEWNRFTSIEPFYVYLSDPGRNRLSDIVRVSDNVVVFPNIYNSVRLSGAYLHLIDYRETGAEGQLEDALKFALTADIGLGGCDYELRALVANLVSEILLELAKVAASDMSIDEEKALLYQARDWAIRVTELIGFTDHKVLYTAGVQSAVEADLALEAVAGGEQGECWRAELLKPVMHQDWLPRSMMELDEASRCDAAE